MDDLISRQTAIEAVCSVCGNDCDKTEFVYNVPQWDQVVMCPEHYALTTLPSAQIESTRTFVELVVEYPDPELCAYKEYKGKPYYSIKYIENGETYVGYGTYNPEVLSQYLKEYFISFAQPEIIRCKDCEYGEQDDVGRWFCRSLGCQIGREDGSGFCADAERRTDAGD